ncbi:MAG TPA: glycosyl hydrolase [Acidimicrobiales bacterium]
MPLFASQPVADTVALHDLEFGVSPQGDDYVASALRTQNELGVEVDIVGWFVDWTQPFPTETARAVADHGWTPAVYWEPWDHTADDQGRYAPGEIARGAHDEYIAQWAVAAREHGGPVLLILAPEMNSASSSWGPKHGGEAASFVAAWRRVRSIFREQGADNVRFVWAPAAIEDSVLPIASMYPGSEHVDAVGMTVFNGGSALPWGGWKSFDDLQRDTRIEIARLAPEKDFVVAAVASAEAGGDKALWIRAMFRSVRADPKSVAVIWFDHDKETNWRIDSSEASLHAIREEAAFQVSYVNAR